MVAGRNRVPRPAAGTTAVRNCESGEAWDVMAYTIDGGPGRYVRTTDGTLG
ncbi:hypothetical protein GCM10009831_08270 [Dietzia cercidiphylli]|uniref:Uncharacterized protein n=1 Tax=Dietzia cercidiphylli TaxID=498199 RepID=A0ABN2IB05_9ACTN